MNVVLQIKGLGHVPSMKNSKMLSRGRLLTKPAYQEWMARAIRSFEFQLLSAIPTTDDATQTVLSQPCSTAWLKRFDDSRQWIAEIHVKTEEVEKGDEGAEVRLETINETPRKA